jgi:hypothetical protein
VTSLARTIAVIVAAAVFLLLAGVAYGEPDRPKKRETPDYDGRGPAPATTGDALRAIPRGVLYPVRLVFDYAVRRPVGAAVRAIESSRTLRRVFRYVFLRPKTPTPQVIPMVMYDFGFRPSIGARVKWTDGFLTPGSVLSVKLATGGSDLWRADAAVRLALGPAFVAAAAGARERDDRIFHGVGPDAPADARARYRHRRLDASARAGTKLDGHGEAAAFVGVTQHATGQSTYGGDRSIDEQVEMGLIDELPAGYGRDVLVARAGATLALDTRAPAARRRESGARLDASIERAWDADKPSSAWTRVDAALGASLLLDPVGERKLDLALRVQHVVADDGAEVPFVELPTATGLRGFATGRLRGESAVALTADYAWPLAAWLDAHAHAGVGNVFGRDLSGLSAGALRGSAGLGLAIAGLSSDRQVRLSGAVGTEPLGDGVDVSSFRVVLGFAHDY